MSSNSNTFVVRQNHSKVAYKYDNCLLHMKRIAD